MTAPHTTHAEDRAALDTLAEVYALLREAGRRALAAQSDEHTDDEHHPVIQRATDERT